MTKAVVFTEFGDPGVLHTAEVPLPDPGPGQVRVAVRTAGVNALDGKIRSGAMRQIFPVTFPHVPGLEAAGVVEALGEGVEGLDVGEEVFGWTVTGSYAEQAIADAARLTIKPDTVDWQQAVALPVAAETAYRAFELLGLRPGETLLVHAAAGAVGSIAVQIALARGLTVIGTASPANHDYLRSLGAVPVAYGEGLADRVRAVAPGGVDAALDGAGRDGSVAASVELTGGAERVVAITDPAGAAEHGVRYTSGTDGRGGEAAIEEALALIAVGKLAPRVHAAYPLADAAQAHRVSESGHLTGKLVLTVP